MVEIPKDQELTSVKASGTAFHDELLDKFSSYPTVSLHNVADQPEQSPALRMYTKAFQATRDSICTELSLPTTATAEQLANSWVGATWRTALKLPENAPDEAVVNKIKQDAPFMREYNIPPNASVQDTYKAIIDAAIQEQKELHGLPEDATIEQYADSLVARRIRRTMGLHEDATDEQAGMAIMKLKDKGI